MKSTTLAKCATVILLLLVFSGGLATTSGVLAQTDAPEDTTMMSGPSGPQSLPVVQLTTDPADDAAPALVQTAEGNLLTVFVRNGNLWSRASSDGGATWADERRIDGCCRYNPSLARKTDDDTIWLTYEDQIGIVYNPPIIWETQQIWYRTSTDGGTTWSDEQRMSSDMDPTDPYRDYNATVFQAPGGNLWLVWESTRTNSRSVWYKTSADGGATWSADAQVTPDGYAPTAISASSGRVVVVWNRGEGELWQRSSSDGGTTWSTAIRIAGCCRRNPSATAIGAALWLAYENDGDIWYRTSANQGTTWSVEAAFTRFVGSDGDVTVASAGGEPGYVWRSTRSGNLDIWFGNVDENPPPYVDWIEHRPACNPDSDDTVTFRALARDEIGVASVRLMWTLDGVAQADLPMYDDGAHDDDEAGDGVWGAQHTPLPAGSQVTYTACATDVDANTYCNPNRGVFTVQPPFVKTADILLVLDMGGNDTSNIRPYFTNALDAEGYAYDLWDTGRRCAPVSTMLNQYTSGTLIWAAPYPWASYITVDGNQRSMVQNYLDAGGKLFVTGQGIAYSIQHTTFLLDYLHASYVQYDSGLRTVSGMGLTFRIAGGDGANNQSYPDEINPIPPAQTIFTYTGGTVQPEPAQPTRGSALASPSVPPSLVPDAHGAWLAPDTPAEPAVAPPATPAGCVGSCTAGIHVKTDVYSVVYLAFGFEAINSATSRNCVMRNALNLLNSTPLQPCPLSPADGKVVSPGDVTFSWSSVPDATDYEIQIEPDGINQVMPGTTYTHYLAIPGARNWRVRASGGEWSAYSSFAVAMDFVQVTTDPADDMAPALLQTADGTLLAVFVRNGHLWSRTSADDGTTWEAEVWIDGCCRYNPSLTRAADGILWLAYDRDGDIWYRTWAGQDTDWSEEQRLTTDPASDYDPVVFQATDGRLWVVWTSSRSDGSSIWYKTRGNGGITWSDDTKLSTGYGNSAPAATAALDNQIVVIWERGYNGLWQRSSSDGGVTWNAEEQIANWSRYGPSLATIGENLWLAYALEGDIWYRTSADQAATWSNEVRVTRFVGSDSSVALTALTPDRLGFVWSSNRRVNPDIWFGILGDRVDLNPPPYVEWIEHRPVPNPDSDDTITFRARAMDETGVASVSLLWTLNDVAQVDLPMYDDGAHGDNSAGDGVWGVHHEALPEGSRVNYQALATDEAGNSYRNPHRNSFRVLPAFVKTAGILFVPDAGSGTNTPNDTAWFRPFYTNTLQALDYRYDTWDTTLRGEPDSAILNQYVRGVIIWAVPYRGYVTDNVSSSLRQLQAYLDAGGNLFITGQNIVQNLYWTDFVIHYLHATYRQGDTGLYALAGASEDPIGNGLMLNVSGGDGANNQYSKDEVDPISPAEVVFTYQTGDSAMLVEPIRPTELAQTLTEAATPALPDGNVGSGTAGLRVDTGNYKVVFFAFGFEAINNAVDRTTVMERVLAWLQVSGSRRIHLPLIIVAG